MGKGRHDTGQAQNVIQPDDSTESSRIGILCVYQCVW
jgi:hypothetical protein